ncbi:MAG TPA: MotA/TolQ/ExbB proton channel family protein [Candidatus Binatia bacterium]|nr:MotA/TolQ/ExbB proton channel family protein [Candidatus Binatia bacterium]
MRALNLTHRFAVVAIAAAGMTALTALAQDQKPAPAQGKAGAPQAQTLEQLLEQTRAAKQQEAAINAQREQRFLQDRNQQAGLLGQARADKAAQEARSRQLAAEFDANEKKLTELQSVLDAKGGNLGELFGTVRVVAGDTSSVLYNSIISARAPGRDEFMTKLAQTKALPSIDELQQMWFLMQQEMTESGVSARFKTKVVQPDGEAEEAEVVTIGPFTAMSDGDYLQYLPAEHQLAVLSRQPEDYTGYADDVQDENEGYVQGVVDPTRGVLMQLYLLRPNFLERIKGGHLVGYLIILMGLAATIASIRQMLFLWSTRKAVQAQLANVGRPTADNPLGRVLLAFKGDAKKVDEDPEVVELRISEAVLREVPPLERYQSFLRLVVAAGPLFGLIGTVIGMIITFQSITESGSGDPKLMATGIGQAMIATVLGLGVAIPFLFVNAALQSMSKQIVQILDEQSTGLLAEQLEKGRKAA